MKVVVSLEYIQSLQNVMSSMLMDMSITNPYWDSVTQMIRGLNKIIARPELYAIKNWVKDGQDGSSSKSG